jgi:hypothetical protein
VKGQDSEATFEVLPCIFQREYQECNKHIYFDPLVREAEPKFQRAELDLKQVSLQGRRMIGL